MQMNGLHVKSYLCDFTYVEETGCLCISSFVFVHLPFTFENQQVSLPTFHV